LLFQKRILIQLSLLVLVILSPLCIAKANTSDYYHELVEKAEELELSPTDRLSGKTVSALLGVSLSADSSALTLENLCVLMQKYLDKQALLLPALHDRSPDISYTMIGHLSDVTAIYQSGVLGEKLTYKDVSKKVTVGQGCVLLSRFLSALVAPDHFQPVSSLKEDTGAQLESLEHTLFLGHSNALALYRYTDTPMCYGALNGVTVENFLKVNLTVLPEESVKNVKTILARDSYEKVYIMLGTNDLVHGTENLGVYSDCLAEIVALIRTYQPDAKLCLVGITPLKLSFPYRVEFRQEIIRAYNQTQKSLSRDLNISYLDVFTPLASPSGYNRPELAMEDGIHFKKAGYDILLRQLITHPLL